MFTNFFLELRQAKVPVSIKEYLALMEAMDKHVADYSVDDFYYLSRSILVKDERNLDKFDRVFGHVFKGLDLMTDALTAEIPAEWLKKLAERFLTEEEKKQIEALGDRAKANAAFDEAEKNGTRVKPEFGSVFYHIQGADKDHTAVAHDRGGAWREHRDDESARERPWRRRLDHERGHDDRAPDGAGRVVARIR